MARPERYAIPLSRSITGMLPSLPHLVTLALSGFSTVADPSFTLSALPSLVSLTVTNCERVGQLLDGPPRVRKLALVAESADRPIDVWLGGEQWDALESLSLEGTSQTDFFASPGKLPQDLVDSLVVRPVHHRPG